MKFVSATICSLFRTVVHYFVTSRSGCRVHFVYLCDSYVWCKLVVPHPLTGMGGDITTYW